MSPEITTKYADVVIAGTGVAGLYAALNLPRSYRVIMVTKTTVEECDSMLAQGGICVLHDESDYNAFFEDTLRAGHYENRRESVDIMIRSSRAVINDLIRMGVRFARKDNGELAYTREAAHSRARICYHKDITGKEITSTLLRHVQACDNIEIREHTSMIDIIEEAGECKGLIAQDKEGCTTRIMASATLMATGGIGGLYEHTTNYPHLTGDALRIAAAHEIELEHTDYVQIHPTSLYTTKPGRAFLISESCRGEGAILLNANKERFTDELQPRDVVTNAIHTQMEKEGSEHVWLSFERIDADEIRHHFPTIYETCLEEGYDITKEPIPVVPAQHYFMGGVHVDKHSETTLPRLFAIGETSCNGVHGKNRLASNSLLESLVFAKRAAEYSMKNYTSSLTGKPAAQAPTVVATSAMPATVSAAALVAAPAQAVISNN